MGTLRTAWQLSGKNRKMRGNCLEVEAVLGNSLDRLILGAKIGIREDYD